jgi:hydroxypyruvate isomerase
MGSEDEPLDGGWSAHLSTLFPGMPIAERTAAAAAAGFRTVETWWPAAELEDWKDAVARHGLAVACLNADAGDLAGGERGFLNDPDRREWTLAAIEEALRTARELGVEVINVLPGRSVEGVGARAEWDAAVSVLRECADLANRAGVTLAVEHLNPIDTPGSFLPDPAVALRLVEDVDADGVRILFDAYHAAMVGLDPAREVEVVADAVAHVQFSCVPGRREPEEDSDLLRRFSSALRATGYRGAIGLEVVPSATTATALESLRRSIAGC